ncbi:MAG TPA: hypothetical protein DHU72_03070 [Rikenellaceae bacterium]|nr:hypothetical protein [Rikenellaceae bacterium]
MPAPPTKDIFVFTPTGELRILAAGSSVLDFAFNIHTNIGCKCTGGRVNGKSVQIREKLKTGDVVEILTGKNQRPTRDWLNWVTTSKARSKIKQELDAEERKLAVQGREILERRLRNWKLDLPDDLLVEFMKTRRFSSVMPFMAAIANEEVDVNDIKTFIQQKKLLQEKQVSESSSDNNSQVVREYSGSSSDEDILVINAKNVKGLDYKLSKCCNPVFGDDVFGFVTRTEGIKIHRISCPNAARLIEKYPYRIQKVIWQDNASSGDFLCTLSVTAAMEHPLLAKIMDVVGQFKVSMRSFNMRENYKKSIYEITIRLLVPSNTELDKVVSQIAALKGVSKIHRV